MAGQDTARIFKTLLALQGAEVLVGLRNGGAQIKGTLEYVMFDSFLVRTANEAKVVAFSNFLFVDPLEQKS